MPVENDIPTHLNIRIDPKLRYLAELASRASGKSLTGYVEDAIRESFKRVSVHPPEWDEEPDVRELTPAERLEKFKKRSETISSPLSEIADHIWSEHPFMRIQLLAGSGLDHLMSEDDKTIWNYLFTRSDLKKKNGALDSKAVFQQWSQIKESALHAKAKGGK